METRRIGELEVSVVGVGGGNFGGRIDGAATREVLRGALEAGVTFLDTADVYPVVPPGRSSASEAAMGEALVGVRDRFVLATKWGMAFEPGHEGGGRPEYVRRCLEESLRRLRTDHVDLFQMHYPDPETPIAETLGALAELVAEGKVREIGCSNFSVAQLREAAAATPPGAPGFVSIQNQCSLLVRDDEQDVLPECEATGLAYLPYFPLYNGLLSGAYRPGKPWPADSRFTPLPPEEQAKVFSERNVGIVAALTDFAEARGHSLLELAIGWLLSHRCLASVIAGATSPDQVRANASAAGWTLSSDELAAVDALAPAR